MELGKGVGRVGVVERMRIGQGVLINCPPPIHPASSFVELLAKVYCVLSMMQHP